MLRTVVSRIDNAWVVIYDRNMFLIQTDGFYDEIKFYNLITREPKIPIRVFPPWLTSRTATTWSTTSTTSGSASSSSSKPPSSTSQGTSGRLLRVARSSYSSRALRWVSFLVLNHYVMSLLCPLALYRSAICQRWIDGADIYRLQHPKENLKVVRVWW